MTSMTTNNAISIALICLGRGDFTVGEWTDARQGAADIGRERTRATSAKSHWSATTSRAACSNSTNRSKTIWSNIETLTSDLWFANSGFLVTDNQSANGRRILAPIGVAKSTYTSSSLANGSGNGRGKRANQASTVGPRNSAAETRNRKVMFVYEWRTSLDRCGATAE